MYMNIKKEINNIAKEINKMGYTVEFTKFGFRIEEPFVSKVTGKEQSFDVTSFSTSLTGDERYQREYEVLKEDLENLRSI
jgi:hypothetical protein